MNEHRSLPPSSLSAARAASRPVDAFHAARPRESLALLCAVHTCVSTCASRLLSLYVHTYIHHPSSEKEWAWERSRAHADTQRVSSKKTTQCCCGRPRKIATTRIDQLCPFAWKKYTVWKTESEREREGEFLKMSLFCLLAIRVKWTEPKGNNAESVERAD